MQAQPRLIDPSYTSFSAEWLRWAPVLSRALAGTHSMADVLGQVLRGDAQLWTDAEAAVVTEIVIYPRRKVLRAWLAGGAYEGIRRIENQVVPWAKEYGCQEIQIVGRLGWRRRLKDYRESAVTMTKEI